ncbi:MAG TPA: hypothetical protein VGW32_09665, partial [Pyrinomonadaceae bacterium]|nr:hypothetical protein [Pyrinomonadaceae bacterium]
MKTRAIFLTALLFALFFVVTGFTQDPDLSGRWAGQMTTSLSGAGGLEIDLARDGEKWKVSLKLRIGGQEINPSVDSLKIDGSQISCVAVIDRTQIKFTGNVAGDKLSGTLEAFQGDRKVSDGNFVLTKNGQMPALQQSGGMQVADPNFDAKVAQATYAKNGPKVLFDEAHNNFHTSTGRYKPFADLIRN